MSEKLTIHRGVPVIGGTPYGTKRQERGIDRAVYVGKSPDWRYNEDLSHAARVMAEALEQERLEELLEKKDKTPWQFSKIDEAELVEIRRRIKAGRSERRRLGKAAVEELMTPNFLTPMPTHITEAAVDQGLGLAELELPRGSKK